MNMKICTTCGEYDNRCRCDSTSTYHQFRDLLVAYLKINHKNFDQDVVNLYWEFLRAFRLNDIKKGIDRYYECVESSTKSRYSTFPSPFHLRRIVTEILKRPKNLCHCKYCGTSISPVDVDNIVHEFKTYCKRCGLIIYPDDMIDVGFILCDDDITWGLISEIKREQEAYWERYKREKK